MKSNGQSEKNESTVMQKFAEIETWTDRLGHSRLRTFSDQQGRFWIEQNSAKKSRWAKLAREGHAVAWEFDSPGGSYTGRMLIDGGVYTTSEAVKKFLRGNEGNCGG